MAVNRVTLHYEGHCREEVLHFIDEQFHENPACLIGRYWVYEVEQYFDPLGYPCARVELVKVKESDE